MEKRSEDGCSVQTDEEHRILIFAPRGTMAGKTVVDFIHDSFRSVEPLGDYGILIDMRRYRGFITYQDYERLAQKWRTASQKRHIGGRIVVVSHQILDRARVSTIKDLFRGTQVAAFRSMRTASEWLCREGAGETAPGID